MPQLTSETVVNAGVNLKAPYGASETRHLMCGANNHPDKEWDAVRPFPFTNLILLRMSASEVRMSHYLLPPGADSWTTGDIVQETAPGSGAYRILYRKDDTLVHANGMTLSMPIGY